MPINLFLHKDCHISKTLFDLHTHSTASDGTDSPTQLVQHAHDAGCVVLALTDHDTLAGLEEARQAAKPLGLNLISGVEIEIEWPHHGEFHLLGLNLNQNTQALEMLLKTLQESRIERNKEIISLMQKNNIDIDYVTLEQMYPKTVIGRPHIAKYLLEKGYVKQYQQAFDRYLAYGRPFYIPKKGLELSSAVQAIHLAGGKAVIAHPSSLFLSWKNLDLQLPEFKEKGLDGLEAYHSTCTDVHSQRFVELAHAHGMHYTGGSDYHGKEIKKMGRLGYSNKGRFPIPENILEIFK
ncbi:MAG: PHP domain-containing protein [Spirochaetia bacterium]